MSQTSRFIRPLLEFLFPAAPDETLQIYHSHIRKAAHFAEYAILAFLAARAFAGSASEKVRRRKYILSSILVAAIAGIDELNQSFEESRSGSVWDILGDISGGAAMVLFLWMSKWQRPHVSKG